MDEANFASFLDLTLISECFEDIVEIGLGEEEGMSTSDRRDLATDPRIDGESYDLSTWSIFGNKSHYMVAGCVDDDVG